MPKVDANKLRLEYEKHAIENERTNEQTKDRQKEQVTKHQEGNQEQNNISTK